MCYQLLYFLDSFEQETHDVDLALLSHEREKDGGHIVLRDYDSRHH